MKKMSLYDRACRSWYANTALFTPEHSRAFRIGWFAGYRAAQRDAAKAKKKGAKR